MQSVMQSAAGTVWFQSWIWSKFTIRYGKTWGQGPPLAVVHSQHGVITTDNTLAHWRQGAPDLPPCPLLPVYWCWAVRRQQTLPARLNRLPQIVSNQ